MDIKEKESLKEDLESLKTMIADIFEMQDRVYSTANYANNQLTRLILESGERLVVNTNSSCIKFKNGELTILNSNLDITIKFDKESAYSLAKDLEKFAYQRGV